MDVHISSLLSQSTEHSKQLDFSHDQLTLDIEQQDCGELGGHCSHSSSHTAGIVLSISFMAVETLPVFLSFSNIKLYIHTQSPPLRPPKA